MKILRLSSRDIQKLCERYYCNKKRVIKKVSKIIEDVRADGDRAVLKYTRRFDKVKLSPKDLRVSISDINAAYQNIDTDFIASLKAIIANIEKFHIKQLPRQWKIKE